MIYISRGDDTRKHKRAPDRHADIARSEPSMWKYRALLGIAGPGSRAITGISRRIASNSTVPGVGKAGLVSVDYEVYAILSDV